MAQAGLSRGSIQIFPIAYFPIVLYSYHSLSKEFPFQMARMQRIFSFFLPLSFFSLGLDFPFESVDCPDVFYFSREGFDKRD